MRNFSKVTENEFWRGNPGLRGGGRGFLTVTEFEDSVSLHRIFKGSRIPGYHVVYLTADVAAAPIIH